MSTLEIKSRIEAMFRDRTDAPDELVEQAD